MTPFFPRAAVALALASLCPVAALAAPGLDAYALTAGGNSKFGANGNPFGCATFGPDGRAALFGRTLEISLPTDGAVCGVGNQAQAEHRVSGPAQAGATLAVNFGTATDPRTFTGTAQARAGYGNLGVRAVSGYMGTSDSGTVTGAQAGARQVETLTIGSSSGSGGTGYFRPTITLDGSLFNVGRAESEIEFGYAVGAGPTLLALRMMGTRDGTVLLYANFASQATLPGMTVSGDVAHGITVAGATSVSFLVPIVFGVPQDISFSLWAAILPSSSLGLPSGSGGDASFFSSARLSGIEVLDSAGQPVPGFTITSGSGTSYGPGGVLAVPEPSTALLLGAGLLGLCGLRRSVAGGRAARV